MTSFIIISIIGLIATLAMTLFMWGIHELGLANADMTRAIGSIYTRSYENAFWPGIFIKLTGGIFFAFIYAVFAGIAPVHTAGSLLLLMTMAGLFHGIAVSILLAVVVAEHHFLERFRKAGPDVMIAHLAGHIVYGFCIGLLFVFTHVDLPKLF